MLIWYSTMMLALEAGSIVQSRLTRMAGGDLSEGHLMVAEKMNAAFEGCFILGTGGDAENVIACYRQRVADNAVRLHGSGEGGPEEG